jgi:P-type Cu2+ transporter
MDKKHLEHHMINESKLDHHLEHDHHDMIEDLKTRFTISIIVTIPILILSPFIQSLFGIEQLLIFPYESILLFILASFVYFYGGYPFFKGFLNEMKTRNPGMDTLITVAITTAYLYSTAVVFGLEGGVFFWELATLIDIMLIGHWLEMKSIKGASNAIEELVKLMPMSANMIMPDGKIMAVPVDDLAVGDRVLIRPGEKIPIDGEIVKGNTNIDESLITGESLPVYKNINDYVIGGSVNEDGSVTVEIKKPSNASYLSQVIDLVKKAQDSKSKTQDLANRFALGLTLITLTSGTLTFLIWYVLNYGISFSIERAVTVMVIACPHALGLAVPLVVAVSTSLSAKNGLLIRNRKAFENARNIGAMIFDKTGTLTMGKFGVTDVIPLDDLNREEILDYAASLEIYSEHPIAKAFSLSETQKHQVEDFKTIPGKGIQGMIDGEDVKIVSYIFLKENNLRYSSEMVDKLVSEGKTINYLLVDGKIKGIIALADIIRSESKETVNLLKKLQIKCIMITGDRKEIAEYVSNEIGLDKFYAEVLPHKKAEKVSEIQSQGLIVAMTGDGINDAPALAQADVGIAIGAGTDVAIEAGDIVLVRSNPLDVIYVIQLARSTYKKMIQNLAWGTGYNIFAIPAAAGIFFAYGIFLTPAIGAVLMSLSTIIVAINSRYLKIDNISIK